VVLAGGLTPENVAVAISVVRPSSGVDVSSGVEDAPGMKNAKKVAKFLSRARKAMLDLSADVMES
jgi:phosphoribosylanthranilate isomerase